MLWEAPIPRVVPYQREAPTPRAVPSQQVARAHLVPSYANFQRIPDLATQPLVSTTSISTPEDAKCSGMEVARAMPIASIQRLTARRAARSIIVCVGPACRQLTKSCSVTHRPSAIISLRTLAPARRAIACARSSIRAAPTAAPVSRFRQPGARALTCQVVPEAIQLIWPLIL